MQAALLALALMGCNKPTITGQVVDPAGQPVAGAMVTNTTGALCTTETGPDGKFALPCSGENLTLAVVLDDWYSNEIKVMGAFDEEIGQVRLVRKAPQLGLWRWESGTYVPLGKTGRARRELTSDRRRHFLVREGYEPEAVPAGKTLLLDDSADEWRLWRVGEGDLIHAEVAPEPNRYETEYGEQPAMAYEDVEGGRDLITVDLTPGDYFLADWTNGRFNQNKKDGLFKGRWIVAK